MFLESLLHTNHCVKHFIRRLTKIVRGKVRFSSPHLQMRKLRLSEISNLTQNARIRIGAHVCLTLKINQLNNFLFLIIK